MNYLSQLNINFQRWNANVDCFASHLADCSIRSICPNNGEQLAKRYIVQAKMVSLWAINTFLFGIAISGPILPLKVLGLLVLIPAVRPLFYNLKTHIHSCYELPLYQRVQCLAIAVFFAGLQGAGMYAMSLASFPISVLTGLFLSNFTMLSTVLGHSVVLQGMKKSQNNLENNFKGEEMNLIQGYQQRHSGHLILCNKARYQPNKPFVSCAIQPFKRTNIRDTNKHPSIGSLINQKICLLWAYLQSLFNLFFGQFEPQEDWVNKFSRERCEHLTKEINVMKAQTLALDTFISERSDLKKLFIESFFIARDKGHIAFPQPVYTDDLDPNNVVDRSCLLGFAHTRQEGVLRERIRLIQWNRELRVCFNEHVTRYLAQNQHSQARGFKETLLLL